MAGNSLGGIAWTVDADTSGAVNSTKQLDMQVDKVEKTLKGLDSQTNKTAKSLGKITPAAKGVNTAVAGMSRRAGMAGIQFQQLIGQIQGGQSAMVALSQQSADLGFVLGAPLLGAISGIAFSLAGMLLPALMGGKSGLEAVQKAVENVKAAMTLGVGGVIEYSAEMKKLKQISSALAEIKIASLIAEQNEAFKTGIKETVKLMDEARDRFALGQLFGKKATKESTLSFIALNEAIADLKLKPTAENVNKVEKALLGVSREGINSTKQGRALTAQMGGLIAEYKLGKMSIEGLQKALKDTNVITDKAGESSATAKEKVASMVSALKEEAKAINEVARQTAIRIATEKGATTAQLASINASFDSIEAKQKEIETQKELDAQMKVSFNADVAREKKKKSKKETETKKAITTTESIISRGETPEEKRAAEVEQIKKWQEKDLENAKLYQDALAQIEKEGADARQQIQLMAMASFSNSFGQIADVLKNSEGEQSSAYKAMFALSKGFAVAQAGLNLALAISNAMASGPFPWNLGAMATVGAAGAGLATTIAGATYGGRENGGSVIGGQTYEVGEKNKPELLMIPGNGGKVFSNSESKGMMGGGGAQLNQTINNYASQDGYQVKTRGDGITAPQVIDIIRSEMGNANSYSRRSLGSTSNVQNKARSRR